MLTDRTVIAAHGGYEILAQRQPIVFVDGSTVGLHRVQFHGHTDLFLRALQHDALHWIVFDLRNTSPENFEGEIKTMMPIDHDGMVFYTLRLHYPRGGAAAFKARALACLKHAWFTTQAEQVAA